MLVLLGRVVQKRHALGIRPKTGWAPRFIAGRSECGVKWLFPGKLVGDGMALGIRRSSLVLVLTEAMVLSRLWAHLRWGLARTLPAEFRLMIRLVHTMATERVIPVMRVRLREMKTTVKLSPLCSLPSRLTIRPRMAMLRVAAGLLVMISPGLWARVTVTSMCRCRLLDSLRGQDLSACLGLRFMSPSSLLVSWALLWEASRPTRVPTSTDGPSEERVLRQTTVTLRLCRVPRLPGLTLMRPPLLNRTLLSTLVPGLSRFTTVSEATDPL